MFDLVNSQAGNRIYQLKCNVGVYSKEKNTICPGDALDSLFQPIRSLDPDC